MSTQSTSNSPQDGREIAIALIKHFEGCKLHAYVLPGENWATIGWGHTIPLADADKIITPQEADNFLQSDLNNRDAELKTQLGEVYYDLTSGQLAATLSFKYNCRPDLFNKSTFLYLLKNRQFDQAKNQLPRWIYDERHIALPGLIRRRKCEEFIFAGGTISQLIELNWYQ
jgi:lysozyme